MTLSGVDFSSYQSTSLLRSILSRISFGIIKASEGNGKDPYHDAHVAILRGAGKLVGHYHYAHPGDGSDADARAEAQFFVTAANPQVGDMMWLDFEPYRQAVVTSLLDNWVLAFTAEVKRLTGASCGIYLNGDWGGRLLAAGPSSSDAALRQLPLWKAEYDSPRPAAPNTLGWPVWTGWQWSDSPYDLDLFNGDATVWHALGVPTKTPPQEADMPLTQADYDGIATAVWNQAVHHTSGDVPVIQEIADTKTNTVQLAAQVAALTTAVKALSTSVGADPAAVLAAVKARLAQIKFSVTDGVA